MVNLPFRLSKQKQFNPGQKENAIKNRNDGSNSKNTTKMTMNGIQLHQNHLGLLNSFGHINARVHFFPFLKRSVIATPIQLREDKIQWKNP